MKIILNIVKYIVLVILIISIISTIALNIITSTILNKEYILGKLEETNYYNNTYNQVESNFENYIYQSGLDENVIKDIITEEEIKADTIQIINNIYEDKTTEVDVEKLENRLKNNIYDSLSGQKISDSTQKSISQFISKITEEYKNTIVHTKYEDSISKIIIKVIKYSSQIMKILIVIDVIMILLLLLLNFKEILRGVAQIGISLSATGIFYIIVNIIVYSKVKIDYITVLNNSFSMSLRNILHNVMEKIVSGGIILLVIGVLLIIISNFIFYKKDNEELS